MKRIKRRQIHGIVLSAGIAIGTVFHYRDILTREVERRQLSSSEIHTEYLRIQNAVDHVLEDLDEISRDTSKKIGRDHGAIFDVQKEILNDPMLKADIEKELREQRLNAEHIIRRVFRLWENRFSTLDNQEMKERGHDIADLGRHLLRTLTGSEGNVLRQVPENSVIVAERLLPSDTIRMEDKNVVGFVTFQGGRNSHAAILARALNIPMISPVDTSIYEIPSRAKIILDGQSGEIIVHPTSRLLRKFESLMIQRRRAKNKWINATKGVCLRSGPRGIVVNANVSTPGDIRKAKDHGCDGIGLYRVEQFYMSSKDMPPEDRVYHGLKDALWPVKEMPVTIRLLDLGGDKVLPHLDFPEQMESVLGLRGVRLLLKYENILRPQIRVLLRLANEFKIQILVPMVSVPDDVIAIRKIIEEEKRRLKSQNINDLKTVPVGAMVETPAAVVSIKEIVECSDFISIGTNDLIQYTMAADREKVSVSKYYEMGHQLIIPWLDEIRKVAESNGLDCSICGEMAGDPSYTMQLLELGFRHFSVAPQLIPRIKYDIMNALQRERRMTQSVIR
ncbi:MAG: phosphoenolpyruvate--protein phosphotransferase [Candidatus Omnitrophica bacterium]|nr:phosphoenolpyruvate--protein phosphotransferase [Candidatus Omnitrophota bacterium]